MANVILHDSLPYSSNEWYSTNDYYVICVAWETNSISTGIPRADYSKCRLWMIHNLAYEVIIKHGAGSPGIGRYVYFLFSSEEDLLLFKLSKWGEMAAEVNSDK